MNLRSLPHGWLACISAIALGWSCAPNAMAQQRTLFTGESRALLARHCVSCHGNQKSLGKLNLETLDSLTPEKAGKILAEMHTRLKFKLMPPSDKKQPAPHEMQTMIDATLEALDRCETRMTPNPGRVTMRRLNRVEYRNTLRDLLGLDFDEFHDPTADFPADGIGYGFNIIGDVLSTSPLLMERYLAAAEKVIDQIVVVDGFDGPWTWKLSGKFLRMALAMEENDPNLFSPRSWISQVDLRQEGDYILRAYVSSDVKNNKPAQMSFVVNGVPVYTFTYFRVDTPVKFEKKLTLPRGRHSIQVQYQHEFNKPKFDLKTDGKNGAIHADLVEVVGPVGIAEGRIPEPHKKIFITRPGPGKTRTQAAEEILTEFCRRAFRRPASRAEVQRYVNLFEKAYRPDDTFEAAMRAPLQAVLVSPNFLYRMEKDPPGRLPDEPYPVNAFELASRLSYFIWSSMPDEELFRAASTGRLLEPRVLEQQVRRMVEDQRGQALAENFVPQWLGIGGVETFMPHPKVGVLDNEVRKAMLAEPVLFFRYIMSEDRSLLDFIDADYTFVNEALGNHYEMKLVQGRDMRRVKIRDDTRGGIMTMASVLTATSYADRTSPVKRGKWVLDVLLGAPPPPPPPDAGPLKDEKDPIKRMSLRQRLETHRTNARCASCHNAIDPLGFGFENYDSLGRWRDRDGTLAIDASATLPDGKKFNGPNELKEILRSRKDEFARSLAEKMLTFALGRGVEPYDRRALDQIARTVVADQYRLSTLVVEITKSYPFRYRVVGSKLK